jgi:hypothetical protein
MEKFPLPFPPVRPMDPAYVEDILLQKEVNQQLVTAITAALNTYNDKCNQAASELEENLNQIFNSL